MSERPIVDLPSEFARLSTTIDGRVERFSEGDEDLQASALNAAKFAFELALQSEEQSRPWISKFLESLEPDSRPRTRSQAKQKDAVPQAPTMSRSILEPTSLQSLYIDGMDDDQIWAQLELKTKNVCETLEGALDVGKDDMLERLDTQEHGDEEDDDEDEDEDEDELTPEQFAKFSKDLEGMSLEEMEALYGGKLGDSEEFEEEGESDDSEENGDDAEETEGSENEDVTSLRDESSEDEEGEDEDDEELDLDAPSSSKGPRKGPSKSRKAHPELDDDFFNLAEFNAEIEEAEASRVSRGGLGKDSEEGSDDGDEDVDYYNSVDAVDAFEEADIEGGGEAFYKDFFAPPPTVKLNKRKRDPVPAKTPSKVRFSEEVKVKTIRANGKGRPLSAEGLFSSSGKAGKLSALLKAAEEEDDIDITEEDDEDDVELDTRVGLNHSDDAQDDEEDGSGSDEEGLDSRETMDRFKDDLFADDDEANENELSIHEVRQAAIREQIAALEAENVADKPWVLKGEVTSRSRPVNSLLEEDLDFERVTKSVPVVTEEVVQGLEARVKARILENRFDDVVRRRAIDDKPFLPSRIIELQDTKSAQSLAQIYEDEYTAAQTGGVAGEDRDGKLKKEHEEIEKLWENICYKLDALSNAHFTPKQPKAKISTITNTSTISIESALPTSQSTSTILAPEEVFAGSKSDLVARSELTPAQKKAQRTKERKSKRKQRQQLEKSVNKFARKSAAKGAKGAKKEKEEALKSVVKTGKGVTVIGKKSQEGKKRSAKG